MRKLRLIANNVIRKNLRSFSWWALVLSPIIGMLIMGGITWYNLSSKSDNVRVAVIAPKAISAGLTSQKNQVVKYEGFDSKKQAEKALDNDDIDGILTVKSQQQPQLLLKKDGNDVDIDVITNNLASINTALTARTMGLSSKQLKQLFAKPQIKQKTVSFEQGHMKKAHSKNSGIEMLISQGVGILMYIFLISYGSIVAQEIGTEKGSRIEETILTAVKAETQFYGKLVGIMGLVLMQVLLYGAFIGGVWLFKAHIPDLNRIIRYIPWNQIDISFIGFLGAFFIVGIITYAILAAVCGSIVSNYEQIGQAITPVMLLAIVGYMIALNATNGTNLLTNILSYTPFISPMLMPVLYGIGQVGLTEALMSLGISVIFLIIFIIFSSRVYKKNVLVYSDKVMFKSLKNNLRIKRK
jgi:ABC-2 type transport system permease protein